MKLQSPIRPLVRKVMRGVTGAAWPAWAETDSTLHADFVNDRAAWRPSVGGAVATGTIAEMFTALGSQGGATLSASGLLIEGANSPQINDLAAIGALGSAHTIGVSANRTSWTANAGLFGLSNDASNDYFTARGNASGQIDVWSASPFVSDSTTLTLSAGTNRISASASRVAINGSSEAVSGMTNPSAPDYLRIGRNPFTLVLNGHVIDFVHWPEDRTAAQQESYTS